MIKEILKPFKFIFKKVKSVVMLPTNLVKSILIKVWAVVKNVLNLVCKIIKKIYQRIITTVKYVWIWLMEAFVETLNQLWTLLGMFAAWLVLEGSAKTTVGYAIILVLVVWLMTIRFRGEE